MPSLFYAGQPDYIEKLNTLATAASMTNGTVAASFLSLAVTGTATAASFVGPLTGNASTATTLATARNINGVAFNGSADITVTAAAGTLTGTTLAANVVNASLSGIIPYGGAPLIVGDDATTGALILKGSGSAGGAAVIVQNGGALNLAIGNRSSIVGGAYSSNPMIYGVGGLTLNISGTDRVVLDPSYLRNRTGSTDAYFGDGAALVTGAASGTAAVRSDNGDLLFSLAATEKARVSSSGLSVTGSISATSLVDISAAGAGQIKFPATQNASADANTLDDYQEATYTGTATGMTTSPTGTVSYTLTGNEATLNLPEITGTSNATTFTVTGMPAEARPASRKTVLGRAQDNGGAIVPVRIDIETTGVLTIYANADAGAFTASGSKTLAECSVTYTRV